MPDLIKTFTDSHLKSVMLSQKNMDKAPCEKGCNIIGQKTITEDEDMPHQKKKSFGGKQIK